jgi:hypothetical protein
MPPKFVVSSAPFTLREDRHVDVAGTPDAVEARACSGRNCPTC